MPFYEYQCEKCGHELEAMQKVTEAPLKKCPNCGKSALKRLMSAPVFRLKGSGWYETDFKSEQDNKRNLDKPEEDAPKKEEKKDETKVPAADATKEAAPAAKEAKPESTPAENKPSKQKTLSKRKGAKNLKPKKAAKKTAAKSKRRR